MEARKKEVKVEDKWSSLKERLLDGSGVLLFTLCPDKPDSSPYLTKNNFEK